MTSWIMVYIASAAFSGIVSGVQLERGCIERNPLAPPRPAYNLGFKAATSFGIGVSIHLTKHESPKFSRFIALTATSANLAVGLHDAKQHCSH